MIKSGLNIGYPMAEGDVNSIVKSVCGDSTRKATISHVTSGVIYYKVKCDDLGSFMFQVDTNDKEDVGTATFDAEMRVITLMRYVRKSLKNMTFFEVV